MFITSDRAEAANPIVGMSQHRSPQQERQLTPPTRRIRASSHTLVQPGTGELRRRREAEERQALLLP